MRVMSLQEEMYAEVKDWMALRITKADFLDSMQYSEGNSITGLQNGGPVNWQQLKQVFGMLGFCK